MAERITDKLARGLAAPAAGQAIIWDAVLPGFGLRVTRAGAKAFILNYRSGGVERRLTIGRYPTWSLEAARREAKALRQRIDRGEDPLGARHDDRAAPTVADLAARYIEEHLPRKRPSSQRRDQEMLHADILPALARTKVAAVTHADIYNLHRKVTKRAPIRANRALALLSTMFNLAIRPWGYRADNPAKGVERNPENKRERYLSPAEIARLVEALKAYPGRSAANCIKLLLLTGARKSECLNARWREFDLEAGTWVKPSSQTKQKKDHRIPLSAPTRQLLVDIRPHDAQPDDFIFPGRMPSEPIKQLTSCWAAVTKAAEIKDARVHDLRHTFASMLASSGSSLPVIGAMLGHTQAATTQRYAHLLDDPLREAAERVGAIVEGGKGAEIIPLKRTR